MPIREYKCRECDYEFEVLHTSYKETPHERCPECNGISNKLISVPAQPQFKGTGFYSTDYKGRS